MNDILNTLNKSSNKLLNTLIRSANDVTYDTHYDVLQRIVNGDCEIETLEIQWFFNFQAELFEVHSEGNNVCFIANCQMFDCNDANYCFIAGYINYHTINDDEIILMKSENDSDIHISLFSDSKSISPLIKIYSDYETKLNNALNFNIQSDKNLYLLERVTAIEDLEELELCDDTMYIDKIKMLQMLASRGVYKEDELQRVWGEYSLVSQITSQPILMNKAISIALTKEGVVRLVDEMNLLYRDKIKLFTVDGKVKLIFGTTLRGHQSSNRNEIVLPKLGDWRFGYTDKYSAEVVFHEFAHALDSVRPKRYKGGKADVHKHDFVRILDKILVDFSDFINDLYIPENQREQILYNNEKLVYFYSNREKIESELRKKEREDDSIKKMEQSEILSKSGLSENSFPITLILGDNQERKIEFLKYALDSAKKDMLPKEVVLLKSITSKFENMDYTLNKDEISLLAESVSKSSRNNFVYSLPMLEQLKASDYISDFQNKILLLSKGIVDDLIIKDSIRVRSYKDADILKKRGKYED